MTAKLVVFSLLSFFHGLSGREQGRQQFLLNNSVKHLTFVSCHLTLRHLEKNTYLINNILSESYDDWWACPCAMAGEPWLIYPSAVVSRLTSSLLLQCSRIFASEYLDSCYMRVSRIFCLKTDNFFPSINHSHLIIIYKQNSNAYDDCALGYSDCHVFWENVRSSLEYKCTKRFKDTFKK